MKIPADVKGGFEEGLILEGWWARYTLRPRLCWNKKGERFVNREMEHCTI